MPELVVWKQQGGQLVIEDAFIDVELFGHPHAPDRLSDATVRHPAAKAVLAKAARSRGAAAAEGVKCKEMRYPTSGGKAVIACAIETWGFADGKLEALLEELAVLAAQRQLDRGLAPTKWLRRWKTMLSLGLALDVGKAMLAAMPVHCRPCCALPLLAE